MYMDVFSRGLQVVNTVTVHRATVPEVVCQTVMTRPTDHAAVLPVPPALDRVAASTVTGLYSAVHRNLLTATATQTLAARRAQEPAPKVRNCSKVLLLLTFADIIKSLK